MAADDPSKDTKEGEKGQKGTLRVLTALAGPAVIAIVVYSVAEDSSSIFAVATIVGACAFALGSLLGFLFGLPQYLAKEGPRGDKASYQPNTNLTQVSDWLTKIIIGVGLVQFGQLTQAIGDLGDELAPSLGGDPTGKPFGISIVVGFFVIGFLVAYIFTRLRLQVAITLADDGAFGGLVDKKLEIQSKADAKLITLSSQAKAPSPEELKAAAADASPAAKAQVLNQVKSSHVPEERATVVIEAIEESTPDD